MIIASVDAQAGEASRRTAVIDELGRPPSAEPQPDTRISAACAVTAVPSNLRLTIVPLRSEAGRLPPSDKRWRCPGQEFRFRGRVPSTATEPAPMGF
jgi:hypothetical protein